jgi:hypothetical protein
VRSGCMPCWPLRFHEVLREPLRCLAEACDLPEADFFFTAAGFVSAFCAVLMLTVNSSIMLIRKKLLEINRKYTSEFAQHSSAQHHVTV